MQQASSSWATAFNVNNVSQLPYNSVDVNPLNSESDSWAHTVPPLMPWTGNPRPDVVQFTAPPDPCTSQTATSWEMLNQYEAFRSNLHSHLKRKSELDVLDAAPQKVCITEERMAARFKDMHISNQYHFPVTTPTSEPSKPVTNLHQLDSILKDSDSTSKSLVLAPEIRKLIEPERIFNSAFLNKIDRPSMALVLWQPQNQFVEKSRTEKSKPEVMQSCFAELSGLCSENTSAIDSQSEPDDKMEIYS